MRSKPAQFYLEYEAPGGEEGEFCTVDAGGTEDDARRQAAVLRADANIGFISIWERVNLHYEPIVADGTGFWAWDDDELIADDI